MTSNAIKCFRTITRCGIFRQVLVSGTMTLVPIAMAIPPQTIMLNPGDSVEEPTETTLDGRQTVSFTYSKESKGEIEVKWAMATMEMEQLVHNRVVVSGTDVPCFVYAEFVASSTTPYTARTTGKLGFGVTAQSATSGAQAYYIDPATKLSVPMTIVSATPAAIGEIQIGANMAITISPLLAATNYLVHVWVPQNIPTAVILSGQPLGILTMVAQGISFDNAARLFQAKNITRLPGASVAADPSRTIKFRILPDPTDGNGLGYTIVDTALSVI